MTTIWERILNWLQPWWCQRPKQEMWWWNNPPTHLWDDPGTIGEQILHWLQPWWCQRPKKAMIWYEHHLKGNFALSAAMMMSATQTGNSMTKQPTHPPYPYTALFVHSRYTFIAQILHSYYTIFQDPGLTFTHAAAHTTKIPRVNKSKIITATKHIKSAKPTNQKQNK